MKSALVNPRLLAVASLLATILPSISAPGDLDTNFGPPPSTGLVTMGFGNTNSMAHGVIVQPDGKIVAAGYTLNVKSDFALVRYNTDGTLDSGFGSNGKAVTPISDYPAFAYCLALQADGKIVAAGIASDSTDQDIALVRYHPDGTLDLDFGIDGIVTTSIGTAGDGAYAIAIHHDGKIVVAGSAANINGSPAFAVVRYLPNGDLDPDFATGGKYRTDMGGPESARSIALQDDGKILVAGAANVSGDYEFALLRLHANGTVDSDFGSNGKVWTDFDGSDDRAKTVVVQADGKIVLGGAATINGNSQFALVRYESNGTPDPDFGVSGKALIDFGADLSESASAMALQSNGKFVVIGSYRNSGTLYDFALARFLSDGTADNTFGNLGKVTTPFGGDSIEIANAVALAPDGKIVAAGYTDPLSGNRFAIARYEGDVTSGLDITTEPPVLNAPVTDAISNSQVTVTFSLPEAALPGSVKLTFTALITPHALTLASTYESPGDHTFTFDAKNPSTSPAIADGAALGDGSYNVTISYRDAAGNLRAYSGAAGNFRIDTTPPGIAGPMVIGASDPAGGYFPKIVLTGTPLPNYLSQTIAIDLLSGATVTQTPAPGVLIAIPGTTVVLKATDAVGNFSTLSFDVNVRPSEPLITVKQTKGAQVTGETADVTYAAFGVPKSIQYSGSVRVGQKVVRSIFAADGSVALQIGDGIPGLNGTLITKLGDPSGDLALATLKIGAGGITSKNNVALLAGLSATAPHVAAQIGTANSGLPAGVTIKKFLSISGDGELPVFLGLLQGTGISAANNTALCSVLADGTIRVLVQKNTPIGETNVSLISTLIGSKGTLAHGRWLSGDWIIARLTLADRSQRIVRIPLTAVDQSTWETLATTGIGGSFQGLVGTTITSFGLPALGADDGVPAFATVANLAKVAGEVTPDNNLALLTDAGPEPLALLRKGDPVLFDANGHSLSQVTIKNVFDPIVGANGRIAFSLITNRGVPAIGYSRNGMTWETLANKGAIAPGGGEWLSFSSLALPKGEYSGPIFLGKLATSTFRGIGPTNNFGLWGMDSFGDLRLLLRTGDESTGKRIKSFITLTPTPGSLGSASGYNDDRTITVLATFVDKTQSVLEITIP